MLTHSVHKCASDAQLELFRHWFAMAEKRSRPGEKPCICAVLLAVLCKEPCLPAQDSKLSC